MAATVTVTATTEVTFDEVRRRFSVDPANEQASNGCRSEEVESEVGFRRREEDYRHLGGYFGLVQRENADTEEEGGYCDHPSERIHDRGA